MQPALILLLLEGAGDAGFLPSLGHFWCAPVKCDKAKPLLLKQLALNSLFNFLGKQLYPSSAISAPVQMGKVRIKLACSSLLPRTHSGLELKDLLHSQTLLVQSQFFWWLLLFVWFFVCCWLVGFLGGGFCLVLFVFCFYFMKSSAFETHDTSFIP